MPPLTQTILHHLENNKIANNECNRNVRSTNATEYNRAARSEHNDGLGKQQMNAISASPLDMKRPKAVERN